MADRKMIYLDDAIDAIRASTSKYVGFMETEMYTDDDAVEAIENLPSARSDRDIPKKPNETTDRTWGIPHRQAVCPNCDRYIGTMYFIGEGKRKISYCDSCGQAIDWSDWKYEDE